MSYTFVGNVQNRFNFWLRPMDYYDASPGSYQPVEALFGMGWMDGRYQFAPEGTLLLPDSACESRRR